MKRKRHDKRKVMREDLEYIARDVARRVENDILSARFVQSAKQERMRQ